MAIPESDPWYQKEYATPELRWFAFALADAFGAPDSAVGIKGNRTHYRGGHRSRWFILKSPYCTNRSYTVSRTPGDRTGGDGNELAALDLTLPTDKLITLCRRLDAALRSGQFEGVTEWYGNTDGDQRVDGFDNIANRVASSDPTHLWHVHITFDRGVLHNRAFFERLLDTLTGDEDDMTPAQEAMLKRCKDLLEATAYGGRNAVARLETAVAAFQADMADFIRAKGTTDADYLKKLTELGASVSAVAAEEKARDEETADRLISEIRAVDPGDPAGVADLLSRIEVTLRPAA